MNRWANKQGFRGVPDEADMSLNDGVVSDRVLGAYKKASQRLTELGIEHRVVGGLAVGAWGHPRATKDVDFIVNQKAVFDGSIIMTFKSGVPIEIDGVAIDYLTVESLRIKGKEPEGSEVVSLNVLFLMKLRAKRRQDDADLVALIKNGAPVRSIDHWLAKQKLPAEQKRLRGLVEIAAEESAGE